MWECDYPHSDSTWPFAPETLSENLVGVSDHDIDRMTHLNAMKHFSYDPFTLAGRPGELHGRCAAGAGGGTRRRDPLDQRQGGRAARHPVGRPRRPALNTTMHPTVHGWKSIPAMCAATAERFADRPAIVDGDTTADASRTVRRCPPLRGRAGGQRRPARGPGRDLDVQQRAVGDRRARSVSVPARPWCPINTRFKGLEAADILRRSRARVLVTVTDFLGTDYVAMLAAAGVELPTLETIVVGQRTGARGHRRLGRFPRAGERRGAHRGRPAARRGADPTTRPTSSSPRARPGSPRAS